MTTDRTRLAERTSDERKRIELAADPVARAARISSLKREIAGTGNRVPVRAQRRELAALQCVDDLSTRLALAMAVVEAARAVMLVQKEYNLAVNTEQAADVVWAIKRRLIERTVDLDTALAAFDGGRA